MVGVELALEVSGLTNAEEVRIFTSGIGGLGQTHEGKWQRKHIPRGRSNRGGGLSAAGTPSDFLPEFRVPILASYFTQLAFGS